MTNLERQSIELDLLREAGSEFLAWCLASDAQDMLYAVRDMTPEQRKNVLPEIEEAIARLAQAAKECN